MSSNDVTVVLVHGAWADGSSWTKVLAPLAASGIKVTAVQMPLSSLEADIAAVERAIERAPGPVVLAGHAYGGAVITAVRSAKVKALVYVAAGAPDEGETIVEAFYGANPPPMAPDSHGLIYLPAEAFPAAFAPDAGKEEQAVLAAVQRPLSIGNLTVPMPHPLWKDVPSWALVAERDKVLSPDAQRRMAKRMKATIRSHETDHTPIVTAPSLVLGILSEAIASLGR